jgi:hypothetical protein
MNLANILPEQTFTHAELLEIAQCMTKPAVVKYLKNEQATALKAIAEGLPKEGETDAAYLRKQAAVIGALNVFESLLNIEKPTEAGSSQS